MIDLREMLKAGVHFGHKTSRWSPKMRNYIWGAKNKTHLIDIAKTAILLERAGKFLSDLASKGGKFLIIGTKKPAQEIVLKCANELKMPFVVNRWIGGTLSNYDQVKKAITRLLHLRDVAQKATSYYKKKEIVMLQKEIARLEKNIGGIIDFEYPPSAVIAIDAQKEHTAIKEAAYLKIPVIAIVDTNTDPDLITHIIPANDDSPKSIAFIMNILTEQIKEGIKTYEEQKEKARAEAIAARKQAAATPKPETKEDKKIEKSTHVHEHIEKRPDRHERPLPSEPKHGPKHEPKKEFTRRPLATHKPEEKREEKREIKIESKGEDKKVTHKVTHTPAHVKENKETKPKEK
jgi:small subunit ribosomal protein S2